MLEVVPANTAKPCALQQGIEVPDNGVQGIAVLKVQNTRPLSRSLGKQHMERAKYSIFAPCAREGALCTLIVH